jgi:hypothetical protein
MSQIQSAGSLTAVSPEAAGRATSTKRLQVPRACERCKRLRRGCSDFRPCQRCVDSRLAHLCVRSDALPLASVLQGTLDYTHPGAAYHRVLQLLPARVIDYCIERFFERLYPTIPILTTAYITHLRAVSASPDGLESLCIILGMCGQVLLQTEEPEELFRQGIIPEKNLNYGRILLDTAVFVWQSWPRHTPVTMEMCLFRFFSTPARPYSRTTVGRFDTCERLRPCFYSIRTTMRTSLNVSYQVASSTYS